MFSREQIIEIDEKLRMLSNYKEKPVRRIGHDDLREDMSFMLEDKRGKISLSFRDLLHLLNHYRSSEFLNLTDIFGRPFNLKDAIHHVPHNCRRNGVMITFFDEPLHTWVCHQFIGRHVEEDWNDYDSWKCVFGNEKPHKGYFKTERRLKAVHPYPRIGDFAAVGDTFEDAVMYICQVEGRWLKTEDKWTDHHEMRLVSTLTPENFPVINANAYVTNEGEFGVDVVKTGTIAEPTFDFKFRGVPDKYIHVGTNEPTDDNIRLWVDTDEEVEDPLKDTVKDPDFKIEQNDTGEGVINIPAYITERTYRMYANVMNPTEFDVEIDEEKVLDTYVANNNLIIEVNE